MDQFGQQPPSPQYADSLHAFQTLLTEHTVPTGIFLSALSLSYQGGLGPSNGSERDRALLQNVWEQYYYDLSTSALAHSSLSRQLPPLDHLKAVAATTVDTGVVPIALAHLVYHCPTSQFAREMVVATKTRRAIALPAHAEQALQEQRAFLVSALLPDRFDLFTPLPPLHRGTQVTFLVDEAFYCTNDQRPLQAIEIDFADQQGFRTVNFGQRVEIEYPDASEKYLRVRAHYPDLVQEGTCVLFLTDTSDLPQPEEWAIHATLPYDGRLGAGTAYVLYGQKQEPRNRLKNPVLIADAFPGHSYQEMYEVLNAQFFLTGLLSMGYDVVLLTYADGTDYLQLNAFVAIACIEQIKQKRSGTNPLIVGGGSMGGVITRYALAYMEQQGNQHQTSLFFTLDAPHLGAELPPGDQFQISYFARYSSDAQKADHLLQSKAAKQMLYYSSPLNTTRQPHVGPDPLHTDLYHELERLGYPKQCRKIAIANGCGNGLQLFPDGQKTLLWESCARGDNWMLPSKSAQIVSISTISDLKVYTLEVQNQVNYDNAPGGLRSTNREIADALKKYGASVQQWADADNHCFVPTISALGMNTATTPCIVIPPKGAITPFDTYFVSTSNTTHCTITWEICEFLLEQLSPTTTQIINHGSNSLLMVLARSVSGIETYQWNAASHQWNLLDQNDPAWSDALGWDQESWSATVQTVVLNRGGQDHMLLLGRSSLGMETREWNGERLRWDLLDQNNPAWTDAADWCRNANYSTIQTAVVKRAGQDELYLVGRGQSGVDTYQFDFAQSRWQLLEQGAVNEYLAAMLNPVRTAVVNGELYLLGRGGAGMQTYRFNVGQNHWELIDLYDPQLNDTYSWFLPEFESTIHPVVVKMGGQDQLLLLARWGVGLATYQFDFQQKIWRVLAWASPPLTNEYGWANEWYYSTIQTAVVNRDGQDQLLLLARWGKGLATYRFQFVDNTWTWVRLDKEDPPLTDAAGWGRKRYYSTIQTRVIKVAGQDELCLLVRGPVGLTTYQFDFANARWVLLT